MTGHLSSANPIAFVTGATGGFGTLLLERLLRNHPQWRIHAVARGGDRRLRDLGSAVIAAALDEGRVRTVELELGRVDTLEEQLLSAYGGEPPGRIDALVHIAGYSLFGPVLDASVDEIRGMIELNVLAPHRLTQLLAPPLIRARGRVVAVSSVAGRVTMPFYGPYSASKHALEALWEALFHELRWKGAHATVVEPGSYRTGMKDRLQFTGRSRIGSESFFAEEMRVFREMMESQAERFMADPDEVAAVLERAITGKSPPPFRIEVGRDARGVLLLQRMLPGSWFRVLMRAGFERIALRRSRHRSDRTRE